MKREFTAVYIESSDGGYIGYVEELIGAHVQGETVEEARTNVIDAVRAMLAVYRDERCSARPIGAFLLRETLTIPSAGGEVPN